ncbi:MAG: hypothetical protein M1831_002906 [Alyxoria varia]|nr:MAG: hypothetical protein M1831_002906 [Alyxoria varia]
MAPRTSQKANTTQGAINAQSLESPAPQISGGSSLTGAGGKDGQNRPDPIFELAYEKSLKAVMDLNKVWDNLETEYSWHVSHLPGATQAEKDKLIGSFREELERLITTSKSHLKNHCARHVRGTMTRRTAGRKVVEIMTERSMQRSDAVLVIYETLAIAAKTKATITTENEDWKVKYDGMFSAYREADAKATTEHVNNLHLQSLLSELRDRNDSNKKGLGESRQFNSELLSTKEKLEMRNTDLMQRMSAKEKTETLKRKEAEEKISKLKTELEDAKKKLGMRDVEPKRCWSEISPPPDDVEGEEVVDLESQLAKAKEALKSKSELETRTTRDNSRLYSELETTKRKLESTVVESRRVKSFYNICKEYFEDEENPSAKRMCTRSYAKTKK